MFVHDVVGSEDNPVYQTLSIENLDRQYSFLRSAVVASLAVNRPLLSLEVIKALNYHAISCLHAHAGEFRPCKVTVGDEFVPPPHYQVPALMNMFVDEVNRHWEEVDPIYLAAYVLWKFNYIHPFVNGNGRAARAACYFVLCLRAGGWLRGDTILPELIRANREEYVAALKAADASLPTGLDLTVLQAFLTKLLDQQLPPETPQEVNQPDAANTPSNGDLPDASPQQ
jgi:Fic family protein